AEGAQLGLQRGQVEIDGQPPQPLGQTGQMARQEHGAPAAHGDGLEQAIAIGQATVAQGQLRGRPAVDPAQHQPAKRRNTSEPLVPPKPKELDSTVSIASALAWCGTKSRSQPSSGSSRLMVGGATWSRRDRTLKIAST